MNPVTHKGGCHCGRVRFEVDAPAELEVSDCNCSICSMTGYLHLIVPRSRFRLLSGADDLATYTFNTGTAKHDFCKICGIKSFYVPRSHPEGYSVNVRCLDPSTIAKVTVTPFDGRDWEQHARPAALVAIDLIQPLIRMLQAYPQHSGRPDLSQGRSSNGHIKVAAIAARLPRQAPGRPWTPRCVERQSTITI